MRVKFFAIPALDPWEAEATVNSFLAQHRVMSIDRELMSERSGAYWAICVTFVENGSPRPGGASALKKGKVDYREVLPPEEFEVFAELRRLRKEVAERDGVPLYAVFTNEQLAAMVQQRVRTEQKLGQLPGVGAARVEKYGAEFLERLAAAQEARDAPGGDSPR
jgi:superfamily II DNA helicase RecQ